MSAATHAHDAHADHGHGHDHADGHGHDDHGGASHSTLKGYLIGFGLSVVLTAIPFWIVMGHVLPSPAMTAVAVMGLALIQVVVHMIYFLHMNTRSEGGWTILALIFTLVLVVIMLSGSLWVMYNMTTNMMPTTMTMHDARNLP
jgi:cytochrome o ubiquinol oxidase operon protein cyoD